MPLHIMKSANIMLIFFKQTLYVLYIYNSLYEVSYHYYSNFLDEKIEKHVGFETYPNLPLVHVGVTICSLMD